MTYVDGYVLAVPTANKEAYRKVAETAAEIFKKHGATRVVECWADDVPEGKLTSFSIATQRKPDEAALFSWVEWPSKSTRDAGMAKSMPELEATMTEQGIAEPPFDHKRMFWGGFQPIVER